MKYLLLLFCLCSFQMKERIESAKSGDFAVIEANKMVTLLAIRSATPQTVVLEEISLPSQTAKKIGSWPEWVKAKAPGHTSWSMIEIDLETGAVLECYSFSRSTWVQLTQKENLFATLIHLSLKTVEGDKVKRIGPPPLHGELDVRKIWSPPLIFEGKMIENARFEPFAATWPEDGSELSKREVTLYFDRENRFPLPFWIQIETSHLTAAFRTIDSGRNLPVVYRNLPRRIPQFIGLPKETEKGFRLSCKSPKYYKEFELFAVDVTTSKKQIFPISHSLLRGEEERISIDLDREELQRVLEPEHRYTWLLVPTGHSESYTESVRPFVWATKP